jgi:starch synthase
MKILFATSEAQPLIKTGGLADVCGSLPVALKGLRHDVRLILPAYREAVERAGALRLAAELFLDGHSQPVRLLEGQLGGSRVRLYLVDSPPHFYRDGGPYTAPDGHDWPDNAQRFALFSRVVRALSLNQLGLGWRPEVVHCHDWQTGLVPALLAREAVRPRTVFTIHNLSYQGIFSWEKFQALRLPPELWSMHAMEFHGQFSFIKGGLVFADWLTTVSPTYAREICTPAYGYGLEGLLQHRSDRLSGILNGADYAVWDPAHDPLIPVQYDAKQFERKAENKAALQAELGLPRDADAPLVGYVGRLVEQKGIDLLLDVLPRLFGRGAQLVVLGNGQRGFEKALHNADVRFPHRLAVRVGYDEGLAHRIEAGADMFLMPSRFEPCGLNQIYSLRYGTVPVVHRTGGLADTVVDTTEQTLKNGSATGFVFERPTGDALWGAVDRALSVYQEQPEVWRRITANGMRQDFSWGRSAKQYLELYRRPASVPSSSEL